MARLKIPTYPFGLVNFFPIAGEKRSNCLHCFTVIIHFPGLEAYNAKSLESNHFKIDLSVVVYLVAFG